jgi:ABC-type transport system involved in multi-copper enzyme maturation permease subunit
VKYLALLKDSLVETLDRKSLLVVLIISVLLILVCASIGFNELDASGSLQHVVRNFARISRPGQDIRPITFTMTYEVKDVKKEGKNYTFTLEASPVNEFNKSVLTWNAMGKGLLKNPDDPVEGIKDGHAVEPEWDLEDRFLRSQFRAAMMPRVEVEKGPPSTEKRVFLVKAQEPRTTTLEGGHEITLFFGAYSARLPMSLAIFLVFVEVMVADWIGGFFGVMLAIIFTAGFVPGMLQKGTLDLILAKPVQRPVIILAKYLGGLFYVAIPATVLVGGCWLVISWRSGFYNFGFLSAIGVLITIFAVLYSFALLMGVLTRSTIASILLTIGLWFFSFAVAQTHQVFENSESFGFTAPPMVAKAVEKVRLGLPRTSELAGVTNYYILKGNLGPELEAMLEGAGQTRKIEPNWVSLAISSFGFIAVMLAMACWTFSKRDY